MFVLLTVIDVIVLDPPGWPYLSTAMASCRDQLSPAMLPTQIPPDPDQPANRKSGGLHGVKDHAPIVGTTAALSMQVSTTKYLSRTLTDSHGPSRPSALPLPRPDPGWYPTCALFNGQHHGLSSMQLVTRP